MAVPEYFGDILWRNPAGVALVIRFLVQEGATSEKRNRREGGPGKSGNFKNTCGLKLAKQTDGIIAAVARRQILLGRNGMALSMGRLHCSSRK